MKPDGSTRRTCAFRGAHRPIARSTPDSLTRPAPHRSTADRRRPRALRVADLEQRLSGRNDGFALAKPLEHDAVPRCQNVHGAAARCRGRQQADAGELQLVLGPRHSGLGGSQCALGSLQCGPRGLEIVLGHDARVREALLALERRARLFERCGRADRARPAPVSALARAASTAAVSSARVRGSSSGDSAGTSRTTTVLPRTTGSPGSSSIRCRRPATGADTTNRSRTRVSPSSSIVTRRGRERRAPARLLRPLATGRLRRCATTTSTTAPVECASSIRTLLTNFQDGNEVEPIEPAADDEPGHHAAPMIAEKRPRDRLTGDVQRETVHLALQRLHDSGRRDVADTTSRPAERPGSAARARPAESVKSPPA